MANHETSELHEPEYQRTPADDVYRARWLSRLLAVYALAIVAVLVLAWLGVRT